MYPGMCGHLKQVLEQAGRVYATVVHWCVRKTVKHSLLLTLVHVWHTLKIWKPCSNLLVLNRRQGASTKGTPGMVCSVDIPLYGDSIAKEKGGAHAGDGRKYVPF